MHTRSRWSAVLAASSVTAMLVVALVLHWWVPPAQAATEAWGHSVAAATHDPYGPLRSR
ncbi:MAG: hypothetical protein JSR24_04280 [Proteobacteria bacterium]|nr:hypothetical protein [Pseudomonadota bacterium]